MARPDPASELDSLLDAFPLPRGFAAPAAFVESVSIQGLLVHLVGLCARADDGAEVTGSAGDTSSAPVARSYFELLERCSVLEALRGCEIAYPLLDSRGAVMGSSSRARAFPAEPECATWRYSKSNGVAAATSWERACGAAAAELCERDRVLRAWFGETAPIRVAAPVTSLQKKLADVYALEAYQFPCGSPAEASAGWEVAAVFGFPKQSAAPLVFGTSAAHSLDEALERAACEMIQRLGFLWGEQIPDLIPDFAASADYHQEYYLVPLMHQRLRAWLDGEHRRWGSLLEPSPALSHETYFIDLTPSHAAGRFCVAKAISESRLPLAFGRGHPCVNAALPEHCSVHPLA